MSWVYSPFTVAGLYWCLILSWLVILVFYWREHRRLTALSPMIGTMLVVVFLDGARTLLESLYFGTWYTARTRLLPYELWTTLAEPQYVIVPKVLNLLAALMIIGVLVRRWFADLEVEMERQRRTERLYAELQQAHAQLTTAQEAREALTHMIVHDMRTPLTSIITGLQTVQQLEPSAGLTGEMVGGALAGSNRLLAMVNDLLDISKMEAGEMTLHRERFPVGEVVDEAVGLVAVLAREKRVALRVEADAAGETEADREKVRRVLVNLLGNAIKFTPAGGSITVAAGPAAEGGLRVSVSDTGPGIAPEHRERIFDKFYQATPAAAGIAATGLGLTFCKLAVEAHGGQVGVDSVPGQGSRFWFTLPAPQASPGAARASGSAGSES
jgi:signal transduction histidine kinase